jgi:hypothetical protein
MHKAIEKSRVRGPGPWSEVPWTRSIEGVHGPGPDKGSMDRKSMFCTFPCNSRGSRAISPQKIFVFFYPYRTAIFMHFLKHIFGYTALNYAVDRLNLQLSTCMMFM